MNLSETLQALAAHCGIADEYFDIWGNRMPTSDDTRRTLLAAMHLPIADSDPAQILQSLEDADWQRTLPPVLVVREGEPLHVEISLPTRAAKRPCRWQLHLESGATQAGEFTPAQLPRLGKRRLANTDFMRCLLELPGIEVLGYHHFELEIPDSNSRPGMALIVTPATCYQPAAIRGDGRVWGPTVQLYGLRSRRNWGIGDFTDLRNLVDHDRRCRRRHRRRQSAACTLSGQPDAYQPLQPVEPKRPERALHRCRGRARISRMRRRRKSLVAAPPFQARLRCLRAEELVNYPAVAAAKREVLELLYRHFREQHLHPRLGARPRLSPLSRSGRRRRWNATPGSKRYRRTSAPRMPLSGAGRSGLQPYRDPADPAVAEFVAAHAEAVDFHAWLQWHGRRPTGRGRSRVLAARPRRRDSTRPRRWRESRRRRSLGAGRAYLRAAPMPVRHPTISTCTARTGGCRPLFPMRLREAAYAPLIEALRANMRHAGALRIDHVMGLTRLFWVPAGLPAAQGTYVSYPLDDLLGIVALESQRNQCLVIGEDLGTVPEGFRPRLASADFLSYRPFLFERNEDGSFKPPANYPEQALVAVSTHDLPTLAGLWKGSDLDMRNALALLPTDALREKLIIERAQDRARLLMALEREKLLPEGAGSHPVAIPDLTPPFITAIHTYLARSPAKVLAIQPEDILGMVEQANLPGTLDDQHPNWRRRLTLDLEDWRSDERFLQFGEVLRRERGSAITPHPEVPVAPRVASIPRATYRFQFNREFTFAQATELVPYLAALGISHCYASPYLKARPGSGHGYDIVDHAALNPEIGTPEDYDRFVTALHVHGMGQILDVVPNHMGVMGADNAWWLDVLENGPAAAHSGFFDIDWDPLNPNLKGKVLLPLLGDHYGTVLNRGELRLNFDAPHGEFSLFYYQHRLPIDPAAYPRIVGYRIERLTAALGECDAQLVELQSLLTAFSRLPARLETDPALMAERQRDKEVHKRHLAALCAACADIAHHVQGNLAELSGHCGDPSSFDLLHELIQAQGYRLAYWRVASDEINYRRFFDINDLAALRMEGPAVFEATHRFVLDLVAQGKVDGLRIDHPDGLHDPGQYFGCLQERAAGKPLAPGEPLPLYLVIEKILADHEQLPADWPIHGATGYRFANLANALFVDPAAARRMTRVYADFVDEEVDFEELVHHAKKLIMDTALASELNVLANRLARIATMNRDTCDFTLNGLRDALAAVVACFPVYRSYVSSAGLAPDDRRHIEWATAVAKKRSPAADVSIFDFVQGVLTTDIAQGRSAAFHEAVIAFAMKFQQFSSPVMAKGVEDTAFYRYHRLVSLNDVGGEPRRFGLSVAAYHAATRTRAQRWPHNLLATSTHDSKRAEDVRTRIDVLSEMPAAWKLMLKRWRRINRAKKREIDGHAAPSANDEYLLYQTLIGTWPLGDPAAVDLDAFRERITAYMIKAGREAKEHSSWVNVNEAYESALADFIAALLAPGEKNLFLADFVPMARRITHHGLLNSLALTLLKLTSPGVPDIYQGCELWQFNLVDPDNRRPIDFAQRQQLLEELRQFDDASQEAWAQPLRAMLDDMNDGRIKLHLIRRALALREQFSDVFRDGDYQPLAVSGEHAMHVCAYARRLDKRAVMAIVPRLTVNLLGDRVRMPLGAEIWGDTQIELPRALARRQWVNVLTGKPLVLPGALTLAEALTELPVALLATVDAVSS